MESPTLRMARYYQMPINNITEVKVMCSKLILYEFDEELICLDKLTLSDMIMHHENILRDLEDESKPAKKYCSWRDTIIYTKKVSERSGPGYIKSAERKLLCITKVPVDVVVDAEMFREIVFKATVLFRIQADDCIERPEGPEYPLNSTKSFFAYGGGMFSIFSKEPPSQLLLPLDPLVELIKRRKEILADLDSQNSADENIYWDEDGVTLKTMKSENSREFCFYLEGICECEPDVWIEEEVRLKKNTLDLMLNIALGAPMWKKGMKEDEKIKESRMAYWKTTPFNIVHKIDFFDDLKYFVVINNWYNVHLSLPTIALKATLDRKAQILSDLDPDSDVPDLHKGYINEYWTDETYAIRTGVMYNLYREVDCKVVRFEKLKDNNCAFVAHKELFLKLLESYQYRRRNSKNKRR